MVEICRSLLLHSEGSSISDAEKLENLKGILKKISERSVEKEEEGCSELYSVSRAKNQNYNLKCKSWTVFQVKKWLSLVNLDFLHDSYYFINF